MQWNVQTDKQPQNAEGKGYKMSNVEPSGWDWWYTPLLLNFLLSVLVLTHHLNGDIKEEHNVSKEIYDGDS